MASGTILPVPCPHCGTVNSFYEGKIFGFCEHCRGRIFLKGAEAVYYRESVIDRLFNLKTLVIGLFFYFFVFGGFSPRETYLYWTGRYYQDSSHYVLSVECFQRLKKLYPRTRYLEDLSQRLVEMLESDQDDDGFVMSEELEAGTNPRVGASRPSWRPRKKPRPRVEIGELRGP